MQLFVRHVEANKVTIFALFKTTEIFKIEQEVNFGDAIFTLLNFVNLLLNC